MNEKATKPAWISPEAHTMLKEMGLNQHLTIGQALDAVLRQAKAEQKRLLAQVETLSQATEQTEFSEDEVRLLCQVFQTGTRGGDVRLLLQQGSGVWRKVTLLLNAYEACRAGDVEKEPEEGSLEWFKTRRRTKYEHEVRRMQVLK